MDVEGHAREGIKMADYETRVGESVSGWALGGIVFAAATMILIGAFQALQGLAALIDDEFFVVVNAYAYDIDVTAWGWIHLILGVVVAAAGFYLFVGSSGAAVIALVLAILAAIANFFYIPYYPFWSLLIIGLSVWVMWALTRPGVIET